MNHISRYELIGDIYLYSLGRYGVEGEIFYSHSVVSGVNLESLFAMLNLVKGG